jgi:hypothetical protein
VQVALLYAETSQHHKICIAVRQRDNSRVCNVDVKATNKTLSDSLCVEADALSDVKTVSAAAAIEGLLVVVVVVVVVVVATVVVDRKCYYQ